jgi:hypothetical protein
MACPPASRAVGLRQRVALLVALLASTGIAMFGQVRPVPTYGASDDGPAVLLSNADGQNAYRSVVRVRSRATCTGVFLATSRDDDPRGGEASAWVATNGHCVAFPLTNTVLIDPPGGGTVVFDFFVDSQARQLVVPIRRIAYATMKGTDIALVELSARVDELRRQGFEPWRVTAALPAENEPVVVVGAPLQANPALAFLRLAACRLEGRAGLLLEFRWHWYGFERTGCTGIQAGSSGSPVISRRTSRVIALINTSNAAQPWYSACQIDSPCEPTRTGAEQPVDTSYATPLVGIDRCFANGDFDVHVPGCPLDPGGAVGFSAGWLAVQNPLLASAPLVQPMRTWNLRLSETPYYRYKVVAIPSGDCRDLRGYGDVRSTLVWPVIDDGLPTTDGHYMLCGIGGVTRQWGPDWQSPDFPTIARVQIDTQPPTLPASIKITDADISYFVEFFTFGNEIAQYTYKVGPASETSCAEPADYRNMLFEFTAVRKIGRPQTFCARPFDAAGNPGALFEALLP